MKDMFVKEGKKFLLPQFYWLHLDPDERPEETKGDGFGFEFEGK